MRRLRLVVIATATLAGCGDGSTHHLADAAQLGDGDHVSDVPLVADAPPPTPQAGIYITNQTGTICAFAIDATGDAAPLRTITGPTTGLSLPIGIVVDRAGNVYVANREGSTVTVYSPLATGDAAPLRTLTATGMLSPETLALDATENLFVATCPNCGESAGGNIGIFHFPHAGSASDYSIQGVDTGLTDPGVAIDSTGQLVIENSDDGAVETFAANATGDATPLRTFTPAGTQNIQSIVAANGVIALASPTDGIDLFDATATGPSVTPAATIAPSTTFPLQFPGGMYLDSTRTPLTLYVADFTGNALYVVELAGTGTQLTVASVRTIVGADTGLSGPLDIAVIH